MDFKKWQAKGLDNEQLKNRKKQIQQHFRIEMGLHIDKPRSGGLGSSNDGNTARRFFREWEKSAKITGLDATLLYRCKWILEALASGCHIDCTKFDDYCLKTAVLLVETYPWFYLPVTVHTILMHGSTIINHFLVPIGQLSEEAQESRNKDIRRFRRDHTRKVSRTSTNFDLMNRLLESSDPVISCIRPLSKETNNTMLNDAKSLLIEFLNNDEKMSDSDESDSREDNMIDSSDSD